MNVLTAKLLLPVSSSELGTVGSVRFHSSLQLNLSLRHLQSWNFPVFSVATHTSKVRLLYSHDNAVKKLWISHFVQTVLFSEWFYSYLNLDQFNSIGESPFNNCWSNIHDFDRGLNESNWELLPPNAPPTVTLPQEGELSQVGVSFESEKSSVPLTIGSRNKPDGEVGLIDSSPYHIFKQFS